MNDNVQGRPPGVERRKEQRRVKADRREEIRFELGKDNRRRSGDRRRQSGWDGSLLR